MTENSIPIQEFNVSIGLGFKRRPGLPRPAERPRGVPVNETCNPPESSTFVEFEGKNLPGDQPSTPPTV
jgi:hypothetical protein